MRHDTVLLLLLAVAVAFGAVAIAQDARTTPAPFVYALTADEEACVAEATGSPPRAWLKDMVAGIIANCRNQVHSRRLGDLGISATGLTDDELAVIVAGRRARLAAVTVTATPTRTEPAPASGTATTR